MPLPPEHRLGLSDGWMLMLPPSFLGSQVAPRHLVAVLSLFSACVARTPSPRARTLSRHHIMHLICSFSFLATMHAHGRNHARRGRDERKNTSASLGTTHRSVCGCPEVQNGKKKKKDAKKRKRKRRRPWGCEGTQNGADRPSGKTWILEREK
jgi:hypothetical protein